MRATRLVVLASGSGTNLQALLDAPDLGGEIVGVLSDRPAAVALTRAAAHGVHADAVPLDDLPQARGTGAVRCAVVEHERPTEREGADEAFSMTSEVVAVDEGTAVVRVSVEYADPQQDGGVTSGCCASPMTDGARRSRNGRSHPGEGADVTRPAPHPPYDGLRAGLRLG